MVPVLRIDRRQLCDELTEPRLPRQLGKRPEEGPHRSGGNVWSIRQPQSIIGGVVGAAVEVHNLDQAKAGPLLPRAEHENDVAAEDLALPDDSPGGRPAVFVRAGVVAAVVVVVVGVPAGLRRGLLESRRLRLVWARRHRALLRGASGADAGAREGTGGSMLWSPLASGGYASKVSWRSDEGTVRVGLTGCARDRLCTSWGSLSCSAQVRRGAQPGATIFGREFPKKQTGTLGDTHTHGHTHTQRDLGQKDLTPNLPACAPARG